jgi:pimeloyl-ACP methyl ester carboxylesterase
MPQIRVHGLDVFYRDEGSGVAIVLGHSSTASSGQWRGLIARLSGRYRLLAPDHIGHGRTAAHSGALPGMEHEIAIVNALIEAVPGPVHLVGHSYGGSILARVAASQPRCVRSLTLIEPTLFHLLAAEGRSEAHEEIKAVSDRVIRFVDAGDAREAARGFIDYWTGAGAFEAMDSRVRDAVVAAMPALKAEFPSAFQTWGATRDALAALKLPILLVSGARSTKAARAVTEILREAWPHARYREIEAAGHMAPVTHADLVNETIDAFVSGCDAQAAR